MTVQFQVLTDISWQWMQFYTSIWQHFASDPVIC